MKKFLILMLFACLTASTFAQIPTAIALPPGAILAPPHPTGADEPCNNFAGTVTIGPAGVGTQTNDIGLPVVYLCQGDSVFINHNGDQILSSDPVPSTTPGIGYAFYNCAPTISGPMLVNIVGSPIGPVPADPCRFIGPPFPLNGLYVATGSNPSGDMWFKNTGALQTTYNSGMPIAFHFAPITLDAFATKGFETMGTGAPGPCVNVNTAAEFEVVYLNAIDTINPILSVNGNSCLGRFKIVGGYPEYDASALYNIDIYLKSNPNTKALIYNAANQLKKNTTVFFSIPVSGTYVIKVEDGKSCGATFEVNMSACNTNQSVGLNLPELVEDPGDTICVPVSVSNFNGIAGFSVNLGWDPTIVQFVSINSPAIPLFDPLTNANTTLVTTGQLGISYSDPNGSSALNLANNAAVFNVCFKVIGLPGQCSPLTFTNSPSKVNMEDQMGNLLGIDTDTGAICVNTNIFNIDIKQQSQDCQGITNVAVTPSGGIAPYDITWQALPGGAVNLAQNLQPGVAFIIPQLPPGMYQIIVTPDNGAGVSDQIDTILTITAPPTLGVLLASTSLPSCNGSTDGILTADVTVNGVSVPNPGLPQFSFNWATTAPTPPVPNPTGSLQANVGFGNYQVTVTQVSTGCTATASGTLSQPAKVRRDSVKITPATCSGVDDGSVTLYVGGGTPVGGIGGLYSFTISYSTQPNDPAAVQIDASIGSPVSVPNAVSGYYSFSIEDANGCTYKEEFEVVALRKVEINTTATLVEPTCNGGSNGSIATNVVVTPSSPTDAFFFAWSNSSSGTQMNTPVTTNLSNIPAGSYFLAVLDAAGCTDTATFVLNEPKLVTIAVSKTNPSCNNPQGGNITVQGLGGVGSLNQYTYNWAPGAQTTATITGLSEGTYSVTTTDLNGCTADTTVTLALPLPPAITQIDSVSVRCGNDGSLSAIAPTAIAFSWVSPSGNTITNPNQQGITGLSGGTYVVVVIDANNCINTDTIELGAVEQLNISDTTLNNPTCFGYNDGSVFIGVAGGNSPYNYAWSVPAVPANGPNILLQKAGTIIVTVTDAQGCQIIEVLELVDPPQIQANFIGQTPATCFGDCNGSITPLVNYFGGAPGNFVFQWGDGSSDSLRVSDLCSGITDVTISDANNCFIETSVDIQSPDAVTADSTETTINPVTCFDGTDGSVSMAVKGGNLGTFTYVWSAPAGATGSIINNLESGNYTVTLVDSKGCTGIYQAVVTEPQPITALQDNATTTLLSCAGDDNAQLGLTITGGNPGNYTYIWSDGTSQLGNTNPLSMLSAGTYSVTVTDEKGCTGTREFQISDPPVVTGTYQPWEALICNGDETTLNITSIMGGAGAPYSYTVDFGVPLALDFPSSIGGGEHSITYIDKIGCEYTETINVIEPDPILVTFNPATIEIQLGDSLTLTPLITGAQPVSFVWAPADFLVNPDTLYPILKTYESGLLSLTVTDSKGCIGVGSVLVDVDPNRNVYLANAFKPANSSGVNDFFNPQLGPGIEIINYMRIYDRWGELMYERERFYPDGFNLTEGWDGRYNGKLVDPGVYIYAIEVKFLDNKKLIYRGDVTVIR